jgi:carbon-monoxide dehydrogenase iron sulfur subunit
MKNDETLKEMINQMTGESTKEILILPNRCDGCNDCVEACKKIQFSQTNKKSPSLITIREIDGSYIPIFCHNCMEAPCVFSCMTGARIKGELGWVETDYKRCVGCWMCIMVCPFGAILRMKEEHLAKKCDGCIDIDIPPCVEVCKPKALLRTSISRFIQERRFERAKGYFLPPE